MFSINDFSCFACRVTATAVFVLTAAMGVKPAYAQDAGRDTANELILSDESPPLEISRDGWRERVREAKRRAAEIASERRSQPVPLAKPIDPAIVATERVLEDDSLQPGDIVSTKQGLFVFQGSGGRERRDSDFSPLQVR